MQDRTKNIPVFKKSYDLALELLKITKGFPREQRFLISSRIQQTSMDLMETIILANESEYRNFYLKEANCIVDRMRLFFMLSKDAGFMDFNSYEKLLSSIDEIGRMIGGWSKHES